MVETAIHITSGITINIDASVKKKNIINVKNIIFGILLLVVAKIVNSYEVLSTIHC